MGCGGKCRHRIDCANQTGGRRGLRVSLRPRDGQTADSLNGDEVTNEWNVLPKSRYPHGRARGRRRCGPVVNVVVCAVDLDDTAGDLEEQANIVDTPREAAGAHLPFVGRRVVAPACPADLASGNDDWGRSGSRATHQTL